MIWPCIVAAILMDARSVLSAKSFAPKSVLLAEIKLLPIGAFERSIQPLIETIARPTLSA